MNGHRQAAVALYGLASIDQERILAELPAQDQRILQDYLAELAALGFDRAIDMADAVVPAAAPLAPRTRLHGSAAADVLAVIAHEPPALIARLLAMDSWPWAAAVLAALPPHTRKLVDAARDAGVVAAPACARFLLAAVDARLSAVSAPPPSRRMPGVLRKWLPWTR